MAGRVLQQQFQALARQIRFKSLLKVRALNETLHDFSILSTDGPNILFVNVLEQIETICSLIKFQHS